MTVLKYVYHLLLCGVKLQRLYQRSTSCFRKWVGEDVYNKPTKRWSEKDENGNLVNGKGGGKLKQLLCEYSFQILEEYIEKFSFFICIKC